MLYTLLFSVITFLVEWCLTPLCRQDIDWLFAPVPKASRTLRSCNTKLSHHQGALTPGLTGKKTQWTTLSHLFTWWIASHFWGDHFKHYWWKAQTDILQIRWGHLLLHPITASLLLILLKWGCESRREKTMPYSLS